MKGRRFTLADFWGRIIEQPETGCWIWLGERVKGGYGRISSKKWRRMAHRWAYEHLKGPIPAGLTLDHLCRNTACVNPSHLEAVTLRSNILRGTSFSAENAVKTSCPKGHPLSMRGNGKRRCRTCNREYMRTRRTAAKETAHHG